jgi:hypothetical protein
MGGGNPAMAKQMEAWRTWYEKHPNIASTRQTLNGLNDMMESTATRVTKKQAQTILSVLEAWKSKPVMTEAQAKSVNAQLTKGLTPAQLKVIASARRPGVPGGGRRGGGPGMGGPGMGGPGMGGPGGAPPKGMFGGRGGPGGGGPGMGGPGGGAMGGGGRMGGPGGGGPGGMTIPAPRDFNPLNPDTLPMVQTRDRAKKSLEALVRQLKSL